MVVAAVLFHVLWGIAHRRDRQRAQHPVWRRRHDVDVEEDGDADREEENDTENPEEKEQLELEALPTIVVPKLSARELGLAPDEIDLGRDDMRRSNTANANGVVDSDSDSDLEHR